MLPQACTVYEPWPRHLFAVVVALLFLAAPGDARANELETLRAENAQLRAENQALRARLDALEGRAEGATASGPSGDRVERVFVPQRAISVRVSPEGASGSKMLSTPWYRTSPEGVLPRKEWVKLRARQAPSGEITGAWLLIERDGLAGTAKSDAARFIVDGTVIEVTSEDYERSMSQRSVGRVTSSTPHEKARFAIPPAAIAQIARGNTIRFEAGSVKFDLTDEHVSSFAAIAARASAPVAASETSQK